MTIDVDEFLEHHGIKGQKWGVRNRRSFGKKGHKKVLIVGGIVGAATLAAGAAFTAKRMGLIGHTPMKAISKPSGPSPEARKFINELMAKHDEQVRLFDKSLRARANITGTHFVSPHVPWNPI